MSQHALFALQESSFLYMCDTNYEFCIPLNEILSQLVYGLPCKVTKLSSFVRIRLRWCGRHQTYIFKIKLLQTDLTQFYYNNVNLFHSYWFRTK